ncbi:MAG: terminase small subunit [Alphaproteobacteria bacterium]|nr:terminase small subunit [Alphaproteobacteria bacterium]
MPVLRNTRHERFAQARAAGKLAIPAYVEAGYSPASARRNAYRLSARPDIRARVDELHAAAAERARVDKLWIIAQLRGLAEQCLDEDSFNPSGANRALELLGKEIGMFTERRVVDLKRIDQMTEAEILELLGGEPDPDELRAQAGAPSPRRT